jgi:hypothetical protein
MSKKNEKEKDEEKDLEEEADEGDEEEDEGDEEDEDEEGDEEDEDEEEEPAAKAADDRRARARARRVAHADHGDHGDHGHDHDDEDEDDATDEDDPYWWTPHAVMGALVLIGVLGFFGVFNKALGGLAAHPVAAGEDKAAAAATSTAKPAQEGMYGAKHLLVMYKGSMRAPASVTRTEEEAKARATEAMKKAKSGAKFEDLVKEYSDEPGAGARGGDLGTFKKGQMVPEFQNAVEKLKVGEVSDLVKTPFGYHVILRTQ